MITRWAPSRVNAGLNAKRRQDPYHVAKWGRMPGRCVRKSTHPPDFTDGDGFHNLGLSIGIPAANCLTLSQHCARLLEQMGLAPIKVQSSK
jgi:hypothetical protein